MNTHFNRTASLPAPPIRIVASAVFVLLVVVCRNLVAADWVLDQTSTITAATVELSQQNSSSSYQGLNGVQLAVGEDSVASLIQRATIGATELTLTQGGAMANSNVQSVNIASAQSINQLTQTVMQPSGSATLRQSMATGSGNIQAINYAFANGTITTANQSFTGQSLTLEKAENTALGNIQAVNYLNANQYSGTISQLVTVDSLTYENRPGGAGDIRINSLQGTTGNADITQTVTVRGILTIDPASATSVIINHIAP